jgi:hypothetical protein
MAVMAEIERFALLGMHSDVDHNKFSAKLLYLLI